MATLPRDPVEPQNPSFVDLEKKSEDLKARIEEAKRHNSMPLDSALGSPGFENAAADGRYDVPDKDED